MEREAIERDLGWVLHLGKENAPAALELVDRLARHCRALLAESDATDERKVYRDKWPSVHADNVRLRTELDAATDRAESWKSAYIQARKRLDEARLLLVRKTEALAIFADEAQWVRWLLTREGCSEPITQWNGGPGFVDPVAFARRERDATEPCD